MRRFDLHGVQLWKVPQQRDQLADSHHLCANHLVQLGHHAVPNHPIHGTWRGITFTRQENRMGHGSSHCRQSGLFLRRVESCTCSGCLVVANYDPRSLVMDSVGRSRVLRHESLLVHDLHQLVKLDCTVLGSWLVWAKSSRPNDKFRFRPFGTLFHYIWGHEPSVRLSRGT